MVLERHIGVGGIILGIVFHNVENHPKITKIFLKLAVMNLRNCLKLSRFIVLVSLMSGISASFAAETPENDRRPIKSRYTLEVGRRHSLCTYLSPLVYHGVDFAIEGEWSKKMPFDPRWEMAFRGGIEFADTRSPARNSSTLGFEASFSWGMERVWQLPDSWSISAGGAVALDGGVLYLRRNSNNPANALARVGLDLRASVRRPFYIGRLHLTAFDQISLPTLGAYFTPEYGETYYEIYLGNHSGLVKCGWWGNNFGLDNLLGVEMHFGKRDLVLGWRYDLMTQHACGIDTQLWRHAAVVGIKF